MNKYAENGKLNDILMLLWNSLFATAVLILYLLVFKTYGAGIPCLFNKITGYKCPGCGMTHALSELTKGNIIGAWKYNSLSITAFPVICLYSLYRIISEKVLRREGFYKWELAFLIIIFFVVILYGCIRNYL